jgi:hypothetical protein
MPPEQSVSVVELQPLGQQPSPEEHAVMAVLLHTTLQFAELPVSWSWVQASASSQLVGQEVAGSHVSPVSTMPLPQLAEQSKSSAAPHAAGQQPSPPTHVVMALLLQAMLHVWALPVSWSWVHALPSSQLVGHEIAGSQVSPDSTMPLPQAAPGRPPPEVPPTPVLLQTPPAAVAPVPAEAPPAPPDWLEDSDPEHNAIAAKMLTAILDTTASEVSFIADSPSSLRLQLQRRACARGTGVARDRWPPRPVASSWTVPAATLVVAGATPNLDYLAEYCQIHPDSWDICPLQDEIQQLYPGQRIIDESDPRIGAALSIVPDGYGWFGEDGMTKIKIPIMIVAGQKDTIHPLDTQQKPLYGSHRLNEVLVCPERCGSYVQCGRVWDLGRRCPSWLFYTSGSDDLCQHRFLDAPSEK